VANGALNYPDGVIEHFIDYEFGTWFGRLCEFGSVLEKVSQQDNDLVRNIVLVVPRREFVSAAVCFGFIYSFLEREIGSESNDGKLELSQLKAGMTISGYRIPLRPELGNSQLEFVAKVADVSKIHLKDNPRITLEVKGKNRDWHINSLTNLRAVAVSETATNKVGFYSEDTEYGQLPWKWLMETQGREIRSFQNPVINIRKNRDLLLGEWQKEFYWIDNKKVVSAPIERVLCPLKAGVPGPFFVDASHVENQIDSTKRKANYRFQILDSIHSIKNNFESPSAGLVLSILARNETATRNLVSAIDGKIINSQYVNIDVSPLSEVSGVEVIAFGSRT